MGQKVVRFSDLSGKIVGDGELVKIVVTQHPALTDGPVEIEAAPSELADIEDKAIDVVSFEVFEAGEEPRLVVMPLAEFDKLATDDPMDVVIKAAKKSYAKPARAKSTGETKVNYGSLEHAGKPHRGKVNDAEKQIIRDHLDQVNERLESDGLRLIDLADAEIVARYGLEELAAERGAAAMPAETVAADAKVESAANADDESDE
ncbi:hypothetical protein [Kutzneria sp. 744]|uniref:hypothetical protein n=1 Tax=Kutzneria sp. (strain 744) TaxID=345341 RepID=UPI0003EEDFA6|nr:hypothetical protein [Kutzneria sp. 744]EWM16683.1 hypothetical protein KUTG_06987 [Kutzneria sp. 744]